MAGISILFLAAGRHLTLWHNPGLEILIAESRRRLWHDLGLEILLVGSRRRLWHAPGLGNRWMVGRLSALTTPKLVTTSWLDGITTRTALPQLRPLTRTEIQAHAQFLMLQRADAYLVYSLHVLAPQVTT